MSRILASLSQPSSWAGIAILLQVFARISDMQSAAVVTAGTAISGALAVFLNEKNKTPVPPAK